MKQERGTWSVFFDSLARLIIRYRVPIIILVVTLTVFFGYRIGSLKMDSSNENAFLQDAPSVVLGKQFKSIFGNDDFVYILVDIGESPSLETLKRIRILAFELEEGVPYLRRLTWLGNVEHATGSEGTLEIREFLDPFPASVSEITQALDAAIDEPRYVNSLISKDKRVLGLLLEMEPYPEDGIDPRKEVAPAVRAILDKPAFQSLNPHVVGIPILDYDMDVITAREAVMFLILVLIVQAILLRWLARGLKGMTVPLIIMVVSNIWVFGIISLLGFSLNLFSIMVPVLLVCVSIGYSMHAIAEYHDRIHRGTENIRAIREALGKVGLPCFITAMTTAVGFLSFIVTDSKMIREMGLCTATGVFIAFGLTLLLVPLLYSFGNRSGKRTSFEAGYPRDIFDRLLLRVYGIVRQRPRSIIVLFLFLTFIASLGYTRLEINTDFMRMFSQRTPIRHDVDFVDSRMGGSLSLEIMIDTGEPDGIKNPEFLKRMQILQKYIDNHAISSKTISLLDTLKTINKALHEGNPDYYILPTRRDLVSQYLFLYETSGGEELDTLVNMDYSIARLTVKTRSIRTKELRNFMDDLDRFSVDTFPPLIKVALTGVMREHNDLFDVLAKGQKKSFSAACIVITLIMIIVLRSVRLGLISMIPNVIPVLFSLGLMGWIGIPMDLALMTFSAVIIGVAVDDTIHFFTRYRWEFEVSRDYNRALRDTLLSVGRPIIFTTITLVLGLAMFTPSAMLSIVRFGLLAGFAFVWALITDLFLGPALILLIKPLGPGQEAVPCPSITETNTPIESKEAFEL